MSNSERIFWSCLVGLVIGLLIVSHCTEPEPPPNDHAKLKQMAEDLEMARVERRKLFDKYQADSTQWAAEDNAKDAEIATLKRSARAVPKLRRATAPELTTIIQENWPDLAAMTDTMFQAPLAAARAIVSDALAKPRLEAVITAQQARISSLRAQRDSAQQTIVRMDTAAEREAEAARKLIKGLRENSEHWEKEAKKKGFLVRWGKWLVPVGFVGGFLIAR